MEHARRAVFMMEDSFDLLHSKPLMLEDVLFCPLLTWMSEQLRADGVERFFVVCGPEYAEAARACFSAGGEVTVSADQDALFAFLEEAGPVTLVSRAAVPVALGGAAAVFAADGPALRANGGKLTPDAQPLQDFTAVENWTHLRRMELACRDRIAERHMQNGVHILDPSAVYIDPRVRIGRGTVVLPGTILRGRTDIGEDCTIGPNAMVRDCTVGDGTEINASQVNESRLGSRTHVGPFAYVRPHCVIGDDIKVGDFVEVKNSTLGNGTKISHLTYVGDSDVGEKVNFGCGTVTTNYDGFKKYRCTIQDGSFIGCNTNLVAPVTVGQGAYIAAGATITQDVPPDALAVARVKQENKEGWAARRRKMHEK